jgi:hypothetical protein
LGCESEGRGTGSEERVAVPKSTVGVAFKKVGD